MNEDIIIPIAGMVFTLAIILGVPLVWAHIRRMSRQDQPRTIDPQADERLERIEQAIDAMALEVERIAEGQRFVTRLLSERANERVAIPAEPDRGS